jgi:phytoene dehydrogenase-like protein
MTTRDPQADPLESDVVVIGAGLAGLTAAAAAAEQPGARVTVLDPHPVGGQARTDLRNGFVFNRGPRALYLGGAGRPILEALGVDTSAGGAPATKGAMGRIDGRALLLPQDFASGIRSPLAGVRDLAQLGPLLARLPKVVDAVEPGQTLQEWIASRRLRPTVAALVHMLARVATYTNAPDVVDARAVLTNMALALTDGVRYLDGGFQRLVDGLLATCERRGVTVVTGDAGRVVHVESITDDRVVVDLGDRWIKARTAVLAAGGPDQAIRLLGSTPAAWTRLGPSPTAACLELGLRRMPHHRVVFGVDEPTYLSTHCPPADLAPPGHAVVHVMRYQPVDDTMRADDQRQLLHAVATSAGIDADDIVEERFLARMVVTGPLPTADGGGLAGRPPVQVADHRGVLVAGDWVGPTGLLSDAAVASGAEAGRLAADRASRMAVA